MKLQHYIIFAFAIYSCKSSQKPAYSPNIADSDVKMTCLDSIQGFNDLNEIDYSPSKLSNSVFTTIDINNDIQYVAVFNKVEQYHDVDILARISIDSLIQTGVDTLLYFRHWQYTNGFNGYGKLAWMKSGTLYQRYIEYDVNSDLVNARFTSQQDSTLKSSLTYFLETNLHWDKCTPVVNKFIYSHPGSYFVYSRLKNTENTFIMSDIDVAYFDRHPKSNFIKRIRISPSWLNEQ
jgi:hypothetical protein